MNDYIVAAIDLVQAINESVVSHRNIKAPCLSEYPPTTDSARTPMILTHSEGATFGRLDVDRMTIDLVSIMLYKPLGQGHFGDTMLKIHEAMDDLFRHYTDEDSYVGGTMVLQSSPIHVSIVASSSAFSMSGYQWIEYPLRSGMGYHGFEMRFQVETSAVGNC